MHVTNQFYRYNIIIFSYFLQLFVIDSGKKTAVVMVIRVHLLSTIKLGLIEALGDLESTMGLWFGETSINLTTIFVML